MLSFIVVVHKDRRVIGVDDLDMGFHDVTFEGLVPFDHTTQKTMDDLSYVYLYCELLDQVGLTMITLHVKSPNIQMHENVLQKGYICQG
jgi:hypothetical protein